MGQTVYVDLFFIINFSMDFLCFFLTAKIVGCKLSLRRGLGGAAIGGLYADIALFLPWGKIASLALDILVCAGMCALVFGKKKKMRSLPLYILVFTAVSGALGGFMTALFHLFNRSTLWNELEREEGDGISVWVFALLALISGAVTLLGGRFFTKKASQTHAEIEVCYNGKSTRLLAMTDSGNLLCEPISGRPCIVADWHAMACILPYEMIRAVQSDPASALAKVSHAYVKDLRLIPTQTAAGAGMLVGVRMERIVLCRGKEAKEVEAWIALADLGKHADGKEALLPSRLWIS